MRRSGKNRIQGWGRGNRRPSPRARRRRCWGVGIMRVVVIMLVPILVLVLVQWTWFWADPLDNNPNTASWVSTFMVSHCCHFSFSLCISFASGTRSQRPHPSAEMVVETETNSERMTPAKRTSPMHPRRQMTRV